MKHFLQVMGVWVVTCLCVSTSFAQLTPTYDDIWVPMRDGDSIQADVYIPTGVDSAQVILIQTPYNKDLFIWSLPMGVGMDLDTQPFIWVIVDWRGFYGSSGADVSNVSYGEDAYDVCDWIKDQVWHLDRIGTWGPSALGNIQYQMIREAHPNHTCAVPLVADAHQTYSSYFYGGVLEDARLQQLDILGYGLSPLILANPYHNALWQFSENTTFYAPDIQIPTLQIGGWYDHNIDKMMDFYEASRNQAAVPVQDEQWLLVGPWVHGGTGAAYVGSSIQGQLTYPNAEYVSDTMAWDFCLHYLLDSANGWPATDYITYYEMGGNDQWWTSNADNIEAVGTNVLYLSNNNQLISSTGAGATSFMCDPSDPSPTIGGATLSSGLDQGPYDQISLDSRTDVLGFETAALNSDISITGRIQLDLYVGSDQPDGDIAVRLVDVYPDGRQMLITDGIKRLRFRNGGYAAADEVFMTSGAVYNVQVDLPFTNYTWLTGHKIKVFISGNHDTRFDVNLQNGGTMYVAGDTNIANITVYHDQVYPSRITLPGTNPSLSTQAPDAVHFELYPNPAQDVMRIDTDQPFAHFNIYDMHGRLIQRDLYKPSIDVSGLESGLYVLELESTSGEIVHNRFIKE